MPVLLHEEHYDLWLRGSLDDVMAFSGSLLSGRADQNRTHRGTRGCGEGVSWDRPPASSSRLEGRFRCRGAFAGAEPRQLPPACPVPRFSPTPLVLRTEGGSGGREGSRGPFDSGTRAA